MPSLAMQAVLFAEPLFVVLLVLAIAWTDLPPAGWSPGRAALLAGAAAALALLTRSIGVAAGGRGPLLLPVRPRAPLGRAARGAAPRAAPALGPRAAGVDGGRGRPVARARAHRRGPGRRGSHGRIHDLRSAGLRASLVGGGGARHLGQLRRVAPVGRSAAGERRRRHRR